MPDIQPCDTSFSPSKVTQLFKRINRYTYNESLTLPSSNSEPLSDEMTDEVMAVVAMYGENLQVRKERKARCVQMILAILQDDTERIEKMRLSKSMIDSRVQNTAEVVSMQLNRMRRE